MNPEDITRRLEELLSDIERLGRMSRAQAAALLHGRDVRTLSHERSLALVALDADSIQDQVFASPRPVTIQGASVILRAWDLDMQRGDSDLLGAPAVVLFAGGGQAVLLTRKEDAGTVRKRIQQRFEQRTHGSPSTTAQVDVSPRELAGGPLAAEVLPDLPQKERDRIGWSPGQVAGFGACMALLAGRMRLEKGAARCSIFLKEPTRSARCSECAERPRAEKSERCERCEANRRKGQTDKKHWEQARSFDDVLGESASAREGRGDPGHHRGRHLAFVRLDGAGIGGLLERLSTMAQYAAVSLALRRAFEIDDSELAGLGAPRGRYQLPIAGGDDLLLVVPAQWKRPDRTVSDALSLCVALVERAESVLGSDAFSSVFQHDRTILDQVRRLGAGAGVVITSNIPARFCFDYALDLVRSAKDAITGDPGARSAVDFAFLHGGSPLASSVKELRRLPQGYAEIDLDQRIHGRVRKTGCPYTLERFKALLERARQLSRVPRSSVHGLRAVMEEPQTGLIDIRYRIARDRDLRRALVGADTPLASLPPEIGPWVLHERSSKLDPDVKWVTAIPDLLDVLRLVGSAREDHS